MKNETANLTCPPEPSPGHATDDGVVSTLVIICLSSLPVLTIAGNVLVIVTVFRKHSFRQKANVFVVSLAIADIAVAIFVMLLSILKEISDMEWLTDPNICLMAWSFDVMFTTTSILHLMCMTIDRYVAICLTFKYHDLINQTCIATLLMLCWSLPAIISFGLIFGKVHMIGIEEYFSCSSKCYFRVNAYYAIICSVISFYIPSLFMLVLNLKIFWNVRVRTRQLRAMTDGMSVQSKQNVNFLKREASVAQTIAIMLSCFWICWLPFFLFNVIDPIVNYAIGEIPWKIVTWFGYVNSTINPYVYYFRNRKNRSCIYKSKVVLKSHMPNWKDHQEHRGEHV